MLFILFILFMTGCYGGERDENHILRGESASWKANLEVVFSADRDMYHIGGNLKYKPHSTPKEVNYYISHPDGKGSGFSRGKAIKIPQGGGTLLSSEDDIEAFADEVTLRVEWEGENGENFEEIIPLN
ncbi:hypothetical protein FGG79_15175 [Bacillus sp. BHET2]|uniref:hypothetical protein n=1 Tax=Bacillus sp. BHET2 TaxID=2583818 RepID=UPI00110D5D55|nr:hypothetical protein [Bacillus sp. BHET2]TMU85215.1 hypothetical protein FGG79_15175 [Bacillus sp. BHET2]